MAYLTIFTLVLSAVAIARAANDWSKPCLSGVCSYDLPASAGSASGTLKIWGPQNAISDITTAAGWEILDCSPDKTSQDIRLVCNSADPQAAGCAHLYENSGAVGKIVRLPESCGKNAFARVANAWTPKEQSIPDAVAKKIARRDGKQPQVRALTLDTDFAAVDSAKAGAINFAIKAANVPGAQADIDISAPSSQRRSRIHSRGLFDFVGDAIDAIKGLNDFDIDKSKTLKPLDVNKNFNLLDTSLSCPPVTVSAKIDVDAKAHAVASIGVAASGTVIPPKVEDFAIIAGLTADLNGSVDMQVGLSGALDSGKIKIFEIGIPGLDFPGILTLGPTFEVNGQAKASLDVNMDLTVGLNYHLENAQLVFPPSSKKAKQGALTVGDTPLKLSVSPSVKATGTVEAHLIPSLNLKISALGDIVDAGVFVELDASASMELTVAAKAQANVTINKAQAKQNAVQGRFMPRVAGSGEMFKRHFDDAVELESDEVIEARAAGDASNAKKVATPKPMPAEAPPKKASTSSTTKAATRKTNTKATPSKATATTKAGIKSVSNSAKGTIKTATKAGSAAVGAATGGATAGAGNNAGGIVATKDANVGFGGCFSVNGGLDVNAGADASFFGLFDKNTKVSLFSKKFDIFQKCFGDQNAIARRSESLPRFSRLVSRARYFRPRALTCPVQDLGTAQPVADETVASAAIKETK